MPRELGLLLLRVMAGGLMLTHGWAKVVKLATGEVGFPDPLGIGPLASLILAALAEFVCSLLVVFGFMTRLSAVPVVITMLVAAFVVHAADPWPKKEFPLLYAAVFASLILTGGGRFALDSLFGKRRRRR